MEEFDVRKIADEEFLTPAVRRYLDRLLDLDQSIKRKLKIKRFAKSNDTIELVVLLESEKREITAVIYEFRYRLCDTKEATLNSPALVKAIDIYNSYQALEAWNNA